MSKQLLNELFNDLVKEPEKKNKLALGAMIEYVTHQQNLDSYDLAILCNIPEIVMNNIFTGLEIPDDRLLTRIAYHLDTTVEILKAG